MRESSPKDLRRSLLGDWLGTLDKSNAFCLLVGAGNPFCGSSVSVDDSAEVAFVARSAASSKSLDDSEAAFFAASASSWAILAICSKLVGSAAIWPFDEEGKLKRRRRVSRAFSAVLIFNLQIILRCNLTYS
jgi:hypothetical protein